ncbi:type II toxin-antitoxin system PemK/MazF family toxin [uncultured Imperialibacter sp.]|uniref:type II toxin-antitoxin system PemK/MazF family toxin n=1 Tax=uncultured Imperialibacter sp. TaxID=1672639 RepID=UPI0030DA74C5
MKQGDVVIASLQQSDGKIKLRPVLVLKSMPQHHDLLVCGISSQLWNFVEGFDEKIDDSHPDFTISGLSRSSIVRIGYLATLDIRDIKGTMGHLSAKTVNLIISRLVKYLKKR